MTSQPVEPKAALTVVMPWALRRALDDAAHEQRVSAGEVTRRALERHLAELRQVV